MNRHGLPGLARLLFAAFLAVCGTLLLPYLFGERPARANDDGGGAPLACIGQSTFFPRGFRWSVAPGQAVTVRLQSAGPSNQNSPVNIPPAVANAAAYAGFSTWAATKCTTPVGSSPFIAFKRGADYARRDNGDNPATGLYNNIVWWVTDPALWGADSTTLAVTVTTYFADTGFVVNGDIAYNAVNFQWRTTDGSNNLYGCNAGNGNCVDIASTAIHEVGHFLGFNHVACNNAVMNPTQTHSTQYSSLSSHEVAGICALYAPNTGTSSLASLGGLCDNDGDCATPLSCLLPANVAAGKALGVCSKPCSASTDCPLAYVCKDFGNAQYCSPGVHLAGVPVQTVAPFADLCLGCKSSAVCSSGICGVIGGVGICTQSCSAPAYACPNGFACTPATQNLNVCWPINPDQCAATYKGQPLNAVCQSSGSATDPNAGINAACQAGLTCFGFPSGIGECVGACSTVDSSKVCDPGTSCCLTLDSNGHCQTTSKGGTTSDGGCFKIQHAGDSCVAANQSVCDATTQCLFTEDATLAKCYHLCPAGSCSDPAETCQAAPSGTKVCCESASFNAQDFVSCVPHPGPCPRGLGVSCSQGDDCESLTCLHNGAVSACSIPCVSDADCPGAAVDVNGDGVPDGGSQCIAAGTQTMCWPKRGPLALPACAIVGDPNGAAAASGGCGGCNQGRGQPAELVLYVVLGATLFRCLQRLRGADLVPAPARGSRFRHAWRRLAAAYRRRP